MEKIKEENSEYKAIIAIMDNFSSHKSGRVKEKREKRE